MITGSYLPQNLIRAGLMGYWPMNEASGSTAYDRSGGGKNGTISGSPSRTTDGSGTVINFDNVDNLVTVGVSSAWNITSESTRTLIIRAKISNSNDSAGLVYARNDVAYDQYGLMICGPSWSQSKKLSGIVYTTSLGERSVTSVNDMADGNWHTFAGEFKYGAAIKLWCDGVLLSVNNVGGGVVPVCTPSHLLYFGGIGGLSSWLNGYISGVAIYNRSLSDTEHKIIKP